MIDREKDSHRCESGHSLRVALGGVASGGGPEGRVGVATAGPGTGEEGWERGLVAQSFQLLFPHIY